MTKIVFTNISVQCWVIYPNVDSLLYGPGLVPVLPSYDVEIVGSSIIPCLQDVHMDGWGLFKMLLVPLPPVTFLLLLYIHSHR